MQQSFVLEKVMLYFFPFDKRFWFLSSPVFNLSVVRFQMSHLEIQKRDGFFSLLQVSLFKAMS